MADVPEPGDLAVVNTLNRVADTVQLLQSIGGGFSQWNHVVVCTSVEPAPGARRRGPHARDPAAPAPTVWIAEAEPGGAVEVPWHYDDVPHQWSTGVLPTDLTVGTAALRYTMPGPWGDHGVPYSFLDYGAIAARRLGVPVPGLRAFIASTGHMICSQLADQAMRDGGFALFDGRWPGYVTPEDIGGLLPAGEWSDRWDWDGALWLPTPAR